MAISFDTTITYNNESNIVAPGTTVTLPCRGTLMVDDLSVTAPDFMPAVLSRDDMTLTYSNNSFVASINNSSSAEIDIKYLNNASITKSLTISSALDKNFIASNIKSNVTIFGVTGSYALPVFDFDEHTIIN